MFHSVMAWVQLLIVIVTFSFVTHSQGLSAKVQPGIEMLLHEKYTALLKGKRIGLIVNQTSVDSQLRSTIELMKQDAKKRGYTVAALFAPEHGITGASHSWELVKDAKDPDGIPIFSLHGTTTRPTEAMLKQVDLLLFDMQDIGSRSYTYISTLFYAMEEAAKKNIPVIVTDRPNPINGIVVDGPMLDSPLRSIVGYINVPYCHGMTIGELAQFFNTEYDIKCKLHVIPMQGWKRNMTFQQTGLPWVPTSPHIPESSTTWYYPMTGIIGELQVVSIGIGYTLPFKLIGAPWIKAKELAAALNAEKLPGVFFQPFYYKPFYGRYVKKECQGVYIVASDPLIFKPVTTQLVILAQLKKLYPKQFAEALEASKGRKEMFNKVIGTDKIYQMISEADTSVKKLKTFNQAERDAFLVKRKASLLPEYEAN
jgi:uncharacterized protein YbbC (DUF1343 family)